MNKTYPVDQENPSADVVNLAATRLRDGGVLIFPTETVYGLGALAAVGPCYGAEDLFDVKLRPIGMAIPLLVPNASDLDVYGVEVPDYARKLAEKFWPGPLTLVVKASENVHEEFRAGDGTIGLRCPNNALVQALLAASDSPIFTTSANTHSFPPATDFNQLEPRIFDAADMVLDGGPTTGGVASSIVRCVGPEYEILRIGALSAEEIEAALA